MKAKYENNTMYLYDNNNINIAQPFWENTYEPFKDKADAFKWVHKYFSSQDLGFIYFDIELVNKDTLEMVDSENFSINTLYKLIIRETTSQLTGEYQVTVSMIDDKNNKIDKMKQVTFLDGEASLDVTFETHGSIHIELDNEYFIGEQKYIFIEDISQFKTEFKF